MKSSLYITIFTLIAGNLFAQEIPEFVAINPDTHFTKFEQAPICEELLELNPEAETLISNEKLDEFNVKLDNIESKITEYRAQYEQSQKQYQRLVNHVYIFVSSETKEKIMEMQDHFSKLTQKNTILTKELYEISQRVENLRNEQGTCEDEIQLALDVGAKISDLSYEATVFLTEFDYPKFVADIAELTAMIDQDFRNKAKNK